MCGISGVFNGEKHSSQLKLDQFLATACITGVMRGMDSTGVYQVADDTSVTVFKKALSGFDFVQRKVAQEIFGDAARSVATVLHHRAQTHGTVTDDNAHPFEHSNDNTYIVGVHNGTVSQFNKKEGDFRFDVDSDWLYYKILTEGAPKALGALNEYSSYALVWYDQEKNKHYIAANGKRPISWGFVKDKNLMLFASEHAHLYWMAKRLDLTFEEEIWSPKEGYIYEFDISDLRKYTAYPVEKPPVKEMLPFRRTNSSNNYSAVHAQSDTDTHTCKGMDWTNNGIAEHGLDAAKTYDFWPFHNDLEATGAWPRLVHGMLVDPENEDNFYDAVTVLHETRRVFLEEADYATAKITGIRRLADKTTSLISHEAYVSLDKFLKVAKREEADEIVHRGPRGRTLTEEQYKEMTKNGCINCSASITLMDQDFISWVNNGTDPCCASCSDLLDHQPAYMVH